MIAYISNKGTDYKGNQIFEALVYQDYQSWPPVLIAVSNTGLSRLEKTVRRFAKKQGEKVTIRLG